MLLPRFIYDESFTDIGMCHNKIGHGKQKIILY